MDLIFARFIQPLAATRFKCRFRLGVLFTTLLISPSSSYSQSTVCASVQPIPGAVGYQSRSGDVRCEGFYQSPVAATALELLSLTLGPIEYQLKDNSFVYVLAPE